MTLYFEQYPKQITFKPKKLVIFLHGYGSNAQDLITLAPEFETALSDAVFISPNAPFTFEGNMDNAYQWYSLLDRSTDKMLKGFNTALPILEKFIAAQLKNFGLTYSDLILAGFSQGGMMTMQSSLVREKEICCAISFSGYVVNHDNFVNDIKSKPPVLMTHGDMDRIVRLAAFKGTLQLLKSHGVTVESHLVKGLGHGIDSSCISKAIQFVTRIT